MATRVCCLVESELRAQRELKVAFAAFGKHFSEVAAARIQGDVSSAVTAARSTPVGMVPHVESLGAELEVYPFIHRNLLKQTHVPVLESGLIDDVANLLSDKGPRGWSREVGSATDPLPICSKCVWVAELAVPRKILPIDTATKV